MLRLFQNVYRDPDPARDAELRAVSIANATHVAIDELIELEGRPTFAEIFSAVNAAAAGEDLSIVANADIYFVSSIEQAMVLNRNEVFALSRWDDEPDGVKLFDRCDSQDAWIFRGPVRQAVINAANFGPGVRGCDNRLAALLAEAGYQVFNPSKTIRAMHLHRTGIRRYSHDAGSAVPPPYLLVDPTELGDPPRRRWIME